MELGYILKRQKMVHVIQWDETRHQRQQPFPISVWISSFFPCGMLYSLRASYTKILASNEDLPQMSAWTPQTQTARSGGQWTITQTWQPESQ